MKIRCKLWGCKIIKRISPGFFMVECARCGDIFKITSADGPDWHDRAMKAILVDCSLFSQGFNISDYRLATKQPGG